MIRVFCNSSSNGRGCRSSYNRGRSRRASDVWQEERIGLPIIGIVVQRHHVVGGSVGYARDEIGSRINVCVGRVGIGVIEVLIDHLPVASRVLRV